MIATLVGKISQHSVTTPELFYLFDQVRDCYRWFNYDIRSSSSVEGLQRIFKVTLKSSLEIIKRIDNKMMCHDKKYVASKS